MELSLTCLGLLTRPRCNSYPALPPCGYLEDFKIKIKNFAEGQTEFNTITKDMLMTVPVKTPDSQKYKKITLLVLIYTFRT